MKLYEKKNEIFIYQRNKKKFKYSTEINMRNIFGNTFEVNQIEELVEKILILKNNNHIDVRNEQLIKIKQNKFY
tara:strand:- start:110 stop:331 length:222 start_codon:yes stop_codon:yes gene_type:complete